MKRREFSKTVLQLGVGAFGMAAVGLSWAQGEGSGFVAVTPPAPVDLSLIHI